MALGDNFGAGQDIDGFSSIELPSPNDLVILKAIGDDDAEQNLSFQGIRRKLGLHQETLSRALHRLQRDGYVERLEHAYRISEKGLNTIMHAQPRVGTIVEQNDPYSVVLLRAVLPPDLNVNSLVDSLSFRWFGNLRWLGSTQTPDSLALSWITNESGLKISVRVKDGTLTIETIPKDSNSISDASRSAFALFDHISKALMDSEQARQPRLSTAS